MKIKFGQKVREIRIQQNLTQEALSFLANVNRSYIGMVERGEINITMDSMKKIAEALQVPLKEFL